MRQLFFVAALSVCPIGAVESMAQEIIPRALYNPATGEVYFDNLDPIFDAGRGRLIFVSTVDTIRLSKLLDRTAGELDLQAQGTTFPTVFDRNGILWQLEGPFESPFEQPVYAGSIVEPGTDINDLVIQSFWLNKEPLGEVVLIPEPATFLLTILSGIVLLPVRRRR